VVRRVVTVEVIFLYQWRVRVKQSGEGDLLCWCGFNASVWLERADDGMKHYRKVKRRHRACLGSMVRNCGTVR
jgi:hypothetical protein